jgi:hypothetical protein
MYEYEESKPFACNMWEKPGRSDIQKNILSFEEGSKTRASFIRTYFKNTRKSRSWQIVQI